MNNNQVTTWIYEADGHNQMTVKTVAQKAVDTYVESKSLKEEQIISFQTIETQRKEMFRTLYIVVIVLVYNV